MAEKKEKYKNKEITGTRPTHPAKLKSGGWQSCPLVEEMKEVSSPVEILTSSLHPNALIIIKHDPNVTVEIRVLRSDTQR